MKNSFTIIIFLLLISCDNMPHKEVLELPTDNNNLVFEELSDRWDEAMPLGNGMVGSLVWKKKNRLRFSLDRADLWDLRPMENINFDEWKFKDVFDHWERDEYEKVQAVFDVPYNQLPAPSKIPAGALEFDIDKLGEVESVELDIGTATCIVKWKNGTILTTFVHAEKPLGWYKFENLRTDVDIIMDSPAYNRETDEAPTSQSRNNLSELGYSQGTIEKSDDSYEYNQKGYGDFSYQIFTKWNKKENELLGCWSVSSSNKGWEKMPSASDIVSEETVNGFESSYNEHLVWWQKYWSKSDITVPDSIIQKQYYLEMYKFGSVARSDAPPIALQAVWTADHGKLPPWKGDFHHDLNTQLSYWPAYTGNHLDLEEGFINWMWKYRDTFKKYTKDYFEVDGLNVPGVSTLEGEPMGGWIQYSLGPTVGAWLSHHFYLHWKYTMDREFLAKKAYPWIKDVAIFLDQISEKNDGVRKLPISSSPEIFNNSRRAWFPETTNFDLALIRWTFSKAAELAKELNLTDEALEWEGILAEWPDLAIDEETGLMFSPELPYHESHRHFSHLMAYHPLGLLDYSKSEKDKKVINNTLKNLEDKSPDWWTGYSYSWQANLYARAFMGDKAAEALRIFAQCFCLKNSFHVNGDQCKAGHSKMTYRPFTLEGNFAFASAVQEMMIQSHTGTVKLFPALVAAWSNASFSKLKTRGAFEVSAEMKSGQVSTVEIFSEKGGEFVMENPFKQTGFSCNVDYKEENGNLILNLSENQSVNFTSTQ